MISYVSITIARISVHKYPITFHKFTEKQIKSFKKRGLKSESHDL